MSLKVPASKPAKAADAGALVDIWTLRLDAPPGIVETAARHLSAEERARAAEFRNETARRNYVVAHAALRLVLGQQLQVAPEEIQFSLGPHGKPALAGSVAGRLEFNLSHSGDIALVATSHKAAVGIDVERRRPMPDAQRIAERFFSAAEAAQLRTLAEAERANAFLNLWTRKEAIAKATGVGIANSLARFAVTHGAEAAVTAVDGNARRAGEWSLHIFTPATGYVGAVAVHSHRAQFVVRDFQMAL